MLASWIKRGLAIRRIDRRMWHGPLGFLCSNGRCQFACRALHCDKSSSAPFAKQACRMHASPGAVPAETRRTIVPHNLCVNLERFHREHFTELAPSRPDSALCGFSGPGMSSALGCPANNPATLRSSAAVPHHTAAVRGCCHTCPIRWGVSDKKSSLDIRTCGTPRETRRTCEHQGNPSVTPGLQQQLPSNRFQPPPPSNLVHPTCNCPLRE